MVVQLSEEREEHLDPTDGVDGTVDGVSHCGFYILGGKYKINKSLHFTHILK